MKEHLAKSKHGWHHIQHGLTCERYQPHSTPCLRFLMWANAKRLAWRKRFRQTPSSSMNRMDARRLNVFEGQRAVAEANQPDVG
jgi:hypothetical protein